MQSGSAASLFYTESRSFGTHLTFLVTAIWLP